MLRRVGAFRARTLIISMKDGCDASFFGFAAAAFFVGASPAIAAMDVYLDGGGEAALDAAMMSLESERSRGGGEGERQGVRTERGRAGPGHGREGSATQV